MTGKVTIESYPNPVSNEITITINCMENNGVVELTDIRGKVVATKSVSPKEQCNFDTRSFSAGTYVVRIKSNGLTVAQSLFVKE